MQPRNAALFQVLLHWTHRMIVALTLWAQRNAAIGQYRIITSRSPLEPPAPTPAGPQSHQYNETLAYQLVDLCGRSSFLTSVIISKCPLTRISAWRYITFLMFHLVLPLPHSSVYRLHLLLHSRLQHVHCPTITQIDVDSFPNPRRARFRCLRRIYRHYIPGLYGN